MAGVTTMEQLVQQLLSNDHFNALLFWAFAVVALVLAAIGIYGVMSFVVAQRRHEVGLRMALGLAGAYAVGRAMQGMWFSVGALDLFRFVAIAVTLIATALLACYVPARRAATVDPAVALRER